MKAASPRRWPVVRGALPVMVAAAIAVAVTVTLILVRLRYRARAHEVAGEFDAAVRAAAGVVTATALTWVGHRAVVALPGGSAMVLHDVPRCVGPGWHIAVSPDRRCLFAVPDRLLARTGHGDVPAESAGADGWVHGHGTRMPVGVA